MAFVVIVEAAAPVASWRVPEALTYHRSLPLPPYTTLVGMLGAALGLALPGAYQFLKEHRIRLGVGGWSEGQGRDLWKFQKLKDKEVESDVLLREFWVETRLALVIEAQDEETAQIIGRAFQSPAFPLTAGPSDSLLKAVAVRVEALDPVSTRSLAYTLIFREISPRYGLHDSWEDLPIHRTIRAPAIERLPSGFAFEADSPRRLLARETVSFIADPIDLDLGEEEIQGYRVTPQSRFLRESPTYSTWKEKLPWIIPVHRYDSPPMPAEPSSTLPLPKGKTPRKGRSNRPTEST